MLVDEYMLQKLLSDLIKIEGINAAVMIGSDGYVIEHLSNNKIDHDAVGAMASTSIGMSVTMGQHLGKGNCEHVLIELEHGPILLTLVNKNEILVIVAAKGANVGRIRYEMKKNKDRIAAALYVKMGTFRKPLVYNESVKLA